MAKLKKGVIGKIIVFALLLILVLGIFFVVINKDTIFGAVANNSKIYTQEQLEAEKDKAYNEGYENALTDNVELKKQVAEYLKIIASDKNTIAEKDATITQNNNTIAQNEITINNLHLQLETLTSDHAEEIAELRTQINSLQLQNETLQNNNASNLATITELNQNIATLENQVSILTQQIEANAKLIAEYEANKEAWQNSIAYYEQFIQALETDTQAVALFEVNGAVYKAQIVSKGTSASGITNPQDTETHSFVGWYINNQLVDINTYPITTNTKFVAKFDIAYNVKFMLDNNIEFTALKIAKDNCPTQLETLPTKVGYAFDGFTINGVDIIDYTTYPITQDTTFIAKFTKVHTVTFIYKDNVIATQEVRNGDFAQEVEVENCDAWAINGEFIELSNYPIFTDVTITAISFEYGLYNSNLELVKSWEELKAENYITIRNGHVSANTSFRQLDSGVLYISEEATSIDFSKCNNLTFVKMPNTITTIPQMAFEECINLREINIPNSVTSIGLQAFNGCRSLTKIVIPDSVIEIENSIFMNCTKLTSVTLSKNITKITGQMFYGCTSLAIIEIPNNIKEIQGGAFRGCTNIIEIKLPNEITILGAGAFYGTSITSVEIPNSVIELKGFMGCEKLTYIEVPENVEIIYFEGCINLKEVKFLGNSIKTLEDRCFKNCSSLTRIELPNGVTSMGRYAFQGCTSLKTIYLPSSIVKTINMSMRDESLFYGNSNDFVVYCGASSKPTNWYSNWDAISFSTKATVKWGYTYEQYCEEVGLSVSTAKAVDTLTKTYLNLFALPVNKFSVGA